MQIKATLILGAAALSLAAGSAIAGTHSVYVGGMYIDLHSQADALQGGPAVPAPGAKIKVGDATTVGAGYVYRFDGPWSLEAALGVPPKHKTFGDGFITPFGQVSSVKQVAPTVFANYHFRSFGKLEPFVGAGLNFTHFSDAHSTASGNAASGGPTRIELSNSVGLAVHGGAAYKIDDRWSIVSTIAYADVRSDLKATTSTSSGDVVRTTRINFRPVAYTLCIGYTF